MVLILFMVNFLNGVDTKSNILKNSGFENNMNHWSIYSSKNKIVNDAKDGTKALLIKNGGLDQRSQKIKIDRGTYQFSGYYKTDENIDGLWFGMNFYDEKDNLIISRNISFKSAINYQKFIVNVTSLKGSKYIQAWLWVEGGEVTLDELKISKADSYNYTVASSLPPQGIAISKTPQFVVIGFDDNTKAKGIDWALDLFGDRKNADGSEARVSFYMNTIGLDGWLEDDPEMLLSAIKRLKNSTHEVGNHTDNHHANLDSSDWELYAKNISNLDFREWNKRVVSASNKLVNKAGISADSIVGFRAPFLLYNNNMFGVLYSNNFLYDCSIEDGHDSRFDGTNFRWPYQLNEGSPSHNENWYGDPTNNKSVSIGPIEGLWELPNHVFMIPKDHECKKYGIRVGLWKRMLSKTPYLSDYKITGFDYNLWGVSMLNKAEFLGILKYNLDLRLQGNHAPFMIGAHTQYYIDGWADEYAQNATAQDMREAISEFIDYALSKSQVRIRPAKDIINWCNNPIPLK